MALPTPGPLGRNLPAERDLSEHRDFAALAPEARPVNVPVAIGIPWYSNFDRPIGNPDGTFSIGAGDLGIVRGGHDICIEPEGAPFPDSVPNWLFYNQGTTSACEGFAHSRMQTLLRGHLYDAQWLYAQAQAIDGQPLPHDGTDDKSALTIMETKGMQIAGTTGGPNLSEGITGFRFAGSVQDILTALGTPSATQVTLLQSWGEAYPHRVLLPVTVLERLLGEQGEAGIVTES